MDVEHHDHPDDHPDGGQDRGRASAADTGGADGLDVLARELADLARQLHGASSSQEVLDRAVATAVALVPGADEGTISLVRSRRAVTSAAATSARARHLDDLQTELGQGPCLDAVYTHRSTRVDDLSTETERWPALAARADEVGMPSMLCLQLFVDGDNLGALNLLGGRPSAFTDASEHIGLLLAAHAAIAVSGARELENTHLGLTHRDVIGQAKGILMERHRLSADQAFRVLAQVSQDLNRKLYDIALDLTATGELPTRPR